MKLTSPTFAHGAAIPKRHTCDGEDVSPALDWSDVPKEARSLALVMDDPDAPPGTWVHWVLFDLPPEATALAEGLPKTDALPDGSRHGLCWGVDDAELDRVGYHGPCPPAGKPHRYYFRLFALDRKLGLPARAPAGRVHAAMRGAILEEAELMGTYGRKR